MARENKWSAGKVIFALVGAVILVLFLINAPSGSQSKKTATAAEQEESFLLGGRGACREFVKRALNDPDSDDWEAGNTWLVSKVSADTVHVEPRLRATNAFGAKMKSEFSCDVKLVGDEWRLVNLVQTKP